MEELLSTREVAKFLNINEKMVYSLIAEKGLPASKVTGKWIFPIDLVKQWVEAGTVNYPEPVADLPPYHGIVLISGSNDLLLDEAILFFNSKFKDHLAMFGFTGSMGGVKALRRNLCHIASSHLVSMDNNEYNFPFLLEKMKRMPAVVNFCMREQGLIVKKGNPLKIKSVADLAGTGATIVNRRHGTGTRQLFDKELKKAGINGEGIKGFHDIKSRHMDIGLAVLTGEADAGPGIRAVANRLGLGFIPICMERFDLLISKERFFDQGIQLFLGILKEPLFKKVAKDLGGYDLLMSGTMVYPETDLKKRGPAQAQGRIIS